MSEFTSSLLANFLGSLFAGVLLALAIYYFVTRRLEIIRPRQERIKEQIQVCSLLIRELQACKEFVDDQLTVKRGQERLQMDTWDALKGSQAVRFLPLECLEPMLKVYADLHVIEFMYRTVEDAQLRVVEAGDLRTASGAERIGRMISPSVKALLLRSQKYCADAINALTAESEHLKSSLGTGKRT